MSFEKKFRLQNGLMASVTSIKDWALYRLQGELLRTRPQLFSIVTVRFRNDVIQLVYYTPWNPETLINRLSSELVNYAHNAMFIIYHHKELGRSDPRWKILLRAVETGLPPSICALFYGGKSHE